MMTVLERFKTRYPNVPLSDIEEIAGTLGDVLSGPPKADIYWLDDAPQGAVVVRQGRGVFVTGAVTE